MVGVALPGAPLIVAAWSTLVRTVRGDRVQIAEVDGVTVEQLLTDTLRAWREAERLLLRLPDGRDHDLVRQAIADLRDIYLAITAPQAPTPERIRVATIQVAAIIATMQEVRTRLGIEG